MEKTIRLGDKEVKFKATASTPARYRERFNRDLFVDIQKLAPNVNSGTLTAGDLECFEDMAYIMAYQADNTIPENPDDWLDQFEMMDIYKVLPQLIELWGMNEETLNKTKKKVEEQSENSQPLFSY